MNESSSSGFLVASYADEWSYSGSIRAFAAIIKPTKTLSFRFTLTNYLAN